MFICMLLQLTFFKGVLIEISWQVTTQLLLLNILLLVIIIVVKIAINFSLKMSLGNFTILVVNLVPIIREKVVFFFLLLQGFLISLI